MLRRKKKKKEREQTCSQPQKLGMHSSHISPMALQPNFKGRQKPEWGHELKTFTKQQGSLEIQLLPSRPQSYKMIHNLVNYTGGRRCIVWMYSGAVVQPQSLIFSVSLGFLHCKVVNERLLGWRLLTAPLEILISERRWSPLIRTSRLHFTSASPPEPSPQPQTLPSDSTAFDIMLKLHFCTIPILVAVEMSVNPQINVPTGKDRGGYQDKFY